MSRLSILFALSVLLALTGTLAADAVKTPEVAVFQVSDLKNESLVKKLVQSLAGEAGVLSAKPETEGGKFLITFEPDKTNPETLTKALAKVAPDAKFEKVHPADPKAAKHDCGKCPSKDKCKGKDKDKK